MSSCEYVYLEPIALIGHDAVLTRGQRTTNEGRCSTHYVTVKCDRKTGNCHLSLNFYV